MIVRFSAIAATAATAIMLSVAQVPAHAQTVIGEPPVSIEDARDIALQQGFAVIESQRFNRNSNRWEIEGRDMDGRDIELEVDANTGAVMDIDRD